MYSSFNSFLENNGYWGSQGAGILAIAIDTGKWLLALRSGRVNYEPYTWSNIGGKVDEGETQPERAARREFFEETEYNGPLKLYPAYIYQSPSKNETGEPKFTYHNFIGEIIKGNWEPKINWETDRFTWLDYKGLLEIKPKHFGLRELLKHSGDLIKNLSYKYNHEDL